MAIDTCSHPACSCAVREGQRFCSPTCEEASRDVERNSTCRCAHRDCQR